MKNRIHISMAAVAAALLLFSACEGDRDPIVELPSSTGVEISNYDNINVGFTLYNDKYTIPVKGCSVIGIPAGEYSMFATTTHNGVDIANNGTMSMKSEKKEIILSSGSIETWDVVPTPSAFSMVTVDGKVNVGEGATASVQVPEMKAMTRTLSLTFKVAGIDKSKVDKCEIYLNGVLRTQNYPGTFLDQSLSTNGDGTTYSMTGSKSLGEDDTEFKLSFPLLGLDSKVATSITTKIYIKDVAEPIRVDLSAAALTNFNTGTSEVSLSNTFTVTETSGIYSATGGTWE